MKSLIPHRIGSLSVAAFVGLAGMVHLAPAAGNEDDSTLLAEAGARIHKYRMSDAVIRVLDAKGNPVPAARVEIRQTRHAFLFGSNIFQWDGLPTPELESAYRKQFADLLNYATLPFYWASYERRQGEPRHERTERIARWCREHNITTKGHPLAWNTADPRWLPDDLDEIRRLQMARIDDCVSRFAGLIRRWDVVNEVTHFDREEMVNRRAPKFSAMWIQTGQMEFTRECFQHARQANPKAILLINDYRTDPAYAEVIEKLVDADGNRLYDVIGIQSHMHNGVWSDAKIWEVCERFARFGVPLHFTETTILSGRPGWQQEQPWPSTPEGEARQARETVRFYTLLFSHPAVEAITWWDFCDYFAWQRAPAGFLRRDMSPKPVFHELKRLIKDQWWTALDRESDAEGYVRFRGFHGDYRIHAASADGIQATAEWTLQKAAPNRLAIELLAPEKKPD